MPTPPTILSARQWMPLPLGPNTQGVATSGSDGADEALTAIALGASVVIGTSPSGYGSADSNRAALAAAQAFQPQGGAFQPQLFGPMGIGGKMNI